MTIPEGYMTIYGFAQLLNKRFGADIRPQGLYGFAKRDKNFPAVHNDNGQIIVNIDDGLAWWMQTSGKKFGPTPDKSRTEPFVGWKYLSVTPEYMLRPSVGDIYGVDVEAVCHGSRKRKPHDIPGWTCTCGLYAYKERPAPELRMFLAQVELYGRVIEARLGYRAQHQRVLALYVVQLCDCCAPATGFRIGDRYQILASCEHHATMTLAELSSNVGTEVRWLRY